MTDGVPAWQRAPSASATGAIAFAVSKVLMINDETAVEAEQTFRVGVRRRSTRAWPTAGPTWRATRSRSPT